MVKKFLFLFFVLGTIEVLKDLYVSHVTYTTREIITTLLVSIAGAIVLTWYVHKKGKKQAETQK